MTRRASSIILCAALLGTTAACAGTAEGQSSGSVPVDKLADDAPVRPVGEPVDCIQASQIRDTQVRSDSVIDFRMVGKKVYRNTLPNSCSSLATYRAFSYQLRGSQLCSIDTITVLIPGSSIPGPTCGLGSFQQVVSAAGGGT